MGYSQISASTLKFSKWYALGVKGLSQENEINRAQQKEGYLVMKVI